MDEGIGVLEAESEATPLTGVADEGEAEPITDSPPEERDAEDTAKPSSEQEPTDYGALVESDLAELRGKFPELKEMLSIYELSNPVRYGALRDLGLTPEEAYLASGGRKIPYDNRSHLTPSVPRGALGGAGIPRAELSAAREIFSELSESDIIRLYRKVTK